MDYNYYRNAVIGLLWGTLFCAILSMLTGCKTKYVSVPEYHNVYVNKHDTLTKHDSIFQKEFIDRYVKGDTVFLTKTQVDYRFRNIYKTQYRDSIRTDSVRVPYPVEQKLGRWEKLKMEIGGWAIGALSIVLLAGIVYIVIFLKRKHLF